MNIVAGGLGRKRLVMDEPIALPQLEALVLGSASIEGEGDHHRFRVG